MDESTSPIHVNLVNLLPVSLNDGAIWGAASEELNVNVVRLSPDQTIPAHQNNSVEVLLVVLQGKGLLTIDGATQTLANGVVTIIPRGSERSIVSNADPLVYLTAHRRRAGLMPS